MKGISGARVAKLAVSGSSGSSPASCLSGKALDCYLKKKKNDIAFTGIIPCLLIAIVMLYLKDTLYNLFRFWLFAFFFF